MTTRSLPVGPRVNSPLFDFNSMMVDDVAMVTDDAGIEHCVDMNSQVTCHETIHIHSCQ